MAEIRAARSVHSDTRDWWRDSPNSRRPALFAVAGNGHGTLSRARWDGKRLTVDRRPLQGERDGDGTVPEWAAVPPEREGAAATESTNLCGDQHGSISHTDSLQEILLRLNSDDPPAVRGVDDRLGFLGFAVDQLAEPGDVIRAELLFDGESVHPIGHDGPVVSAALVSNGSREPLEVEVAADGSDAYPFFVAPGSLPTAPLLEGGLVGWRNGNVCGGDPRHHRRRSGSTSSSRWLRTSPGQGRFSSLADGLGKLPAATAFSSRLTKPPAGWTRRLRPRRPGVGECS